MKEARYRMDVLLTRSDTETFHNSREQMKLSIHQYLSFLINEDAKRLQAEAEQARLEELFKGVQQAAREWVEREGFSGPVTFRYLYDTSVEQEDDDIMTITATAASGQQKELYRKSAPEDAEIKGMKDIINRLNNL